MKKLQAVAVVALAGVLSVGAWAEAQGPRAGGPGRGHGVGGRGAFGGLPIASLNLTQAQQDLIRDIRERHRGDVQQVESKLREARAAQQKAVTAIPVNENAIRSATLALAEVEAEVAVQQARVRNEIFAALTPEQQETVKKAQAAREQRLQERQSQGRANRR
jgi:Spy/CpxP family protein refolding chaperone